ncbi:MAG: DNA-directed RNA polymerase subunit alpha [Ignavibacteriales bacterium]|nr:DNA-directed RNA polymerase subunit alpha [Ignavibacteriales bacterium]
MSNIQFVMPDSIIIEEATKSDTYGKFFISPLERGFGNTIGNSFRRVLLSSIAGAALTAIRIDGVLHEFSTIPGVVEDVTEIVLNLKKVKLKIINPNSNKIDIVLNGPTKFTAEDVQKSCPDIEILNPELHIASINENTNLNLELRYGSGKGYVPNNEQKISEQSIGMIPIDSIFTPIVNVNYLVENVRIGERNDFEKLILEIKTNGSITPQDAISDAARILSDHIKMFINFDKMPEEAKEEVKVDPEFEGIKKKLLTPVDDLELSVRSQNCLRAASIKTLGELVRRHESDLLKFRNFGRKSLAELIEIVEINKLEFGMDVDKYIKDEKENNN